MQRSVRTMFSYIYKEWTRRVEDIHEKLLAQHSVSLPIDVRCGSDCACIRYRSPATYLTVGGCAQFHLWRCKECPSYSIKSEYYQCIGFKFRLDFPIWLSRGGCQRLRKIIMIILLHKIISIIHLPIVFIIKLLQFHVSVVASCLVATELRNLTQT